MVFSNVGKAENDLITKDNELIVVFNRAVEIIESARKLVGRTANLATTISYYEIGRIIVEKEQQGNTRAKYGKKLIENLSEFLIAKFGKGFSVPTLTNARKFFLVYSPVITNSYALHTELLDPKSYALYSQSAPFTLSWNHYQKRI